LLKVLLRQVSEKHGVAAKMIATVDDLEAIAGDDKADVAALRGWRREIFGVKALELKRGKLALTVERGRVVTLEWQDAPGEQAAGEMQAYDDVAADQKAEVA
jgi:ribonuclease D